MLFKSIQNDDFFIDPGGLFHRQGPMYERLFCPMLVFRKGTLSLAKLLLDSVLHWGSYSYTSFKYRGQALLANINVMAFMHWWTLLLTGNQLIDSNSLLDMWCLLSSFRQNRIHLFCAICIFFFSFSLRLGYHKEQA